MKATYEAGRTYEVMNHCQKPKRHNHRDEYVILRERDEQMQEYANGFTYWESDNA